MGGHEFLFREGAWLGDGKITFSGSKEVIPFFTRWICHAEDEKMILCTQDVELQGAGEHVHNVFYVSDIKKETFSIQLENEMIGKVAGSGVIEEGRVAWEFRSHINFQGFEIYKKTGEDSYEFHAEYTSQEELRTMINGRIWKKGE